MDWKLEVLLISSTTNMFMKRGLQMHEKPVEAHESDLYHSKKSLLLFHLTSAFSSSFSQTFHDVSNSTYLSSFSATLVDRSSFICIPFPSAVSSSKGVEELQKRKHTLSFFAVHSCKLDFGLQVHTFTS